MNKTLKRIFSLVLSVFLFVTAFNLPFNVSADTESDLRNEIAKLQQQSKEIEAEIARLKKDKNNQAAVLSAVQKKISNTQAQINRCNSEINSINAKISENKAQIDTKNAEIEQSKLTFKKRLRAIYMSNNGNNIQFLLGAESFAQYLQLSQLTSSVASHDKRMIEDMVNVIKELEEKNKENDKLLAEQVSVRSMVQEQYNALASEEAEAQKIYDNINSSKEAQDKLLAQKNQAIKDKQAALDSFGSHLDSSQGFINPNTNMMWPVPSCRFVYSGYKTSNRPDHLGIDISSAGIYRKPIVAIADGVIYQSYTSCPHRSKTPRCSCGSGFGNHLRIDHGDMTIGGKTQRFGAIYAHMDTVAVTSGYVKQGQVIGYVGTTGDSSGYHLHFSLLVGGRNYRTSTVNPMLYLRAK